MIAVRTMTAVLLTGHGGYEMLRVVSDHPRPQPGPGEIEVRVGACGLNNTDINTRTAWYGDGSWAGSAMRLPRIQGADIAGRIVSVGPGVDPAPIGRRVLVDPWLLDPDDPMDRARARYLGSEVDGGFAEYCVVPERNAHVIECGLTDAELATFPCAYSTAENLLTRAGLASGETLVATGASGGVGTAVVQLGLLRGARVVAIASAAKADHLLDLGASAVVDRTNPDLERAVAAAADGPIDVVADVVGAGMFGPLVASLRRGGRYTTSGAIAGPMVELDLRELIYKDLQLTGATVCAPGTFARIVGHLEAGRLRPLLAATYPLRELVDAQKAFVAKRHVGNIVVEVPA